MGRPPILALDLGRKTGWATDDGEKVQWGTIVLEADSLGVRLLQLGQGLRMISGAAFGDRQLRIVYEQPFSRMVATARQLYAYEGVVLAFAAQYAYEVQAVPAKTLKLFATGKGDADKTAMLIAASRDWTHIACGSRFMPTIDEHECDALWLLHYGRKHAA